MLLPVLTMAMKAGELAVAVVMCYNVFQCVEVAVCCSVCCGVLRVWCVCVAMCCNVFQCVVVYCSVS